MSTTDNSANALGIPPRRLDMRFDAQEMERYWYGQDPFLTLFWGSLSLLFPEGERFFVAAVRHYRDQIQDPQLLTDIAGFIAQEAMHTREHEALNAMLNQQHLPAAEIDAQLHKLLAWVTRLTSPRLRLAATCALEHYTALMGEQLLRDQRHQHMADAKMLPLWLWHALEETEHKTVAYDVYEQTGGGYALRVGTMALTTVVFVAFTTYTQVRMLQADGQLSKVRQNLRGLNYLFGPRGLFLGLSGKFLDYFKPGFHPRQHDTDALVESWRERLFGAQGLLRDQVKMVKTRTVQAA